MLMEAFVLTALDTLWWPQSRGGPLGLGTRPMSLPADDPLLGNHQLLKNKYPNNSSSREQMYSRRNVSASLGLLLFFRLNIYMSSKKQRDCNLPDSRITSFRSLLGDIQSLLAVNANSCLGNTLSRILLDGR